LSYGDWLGAPREKKFFEGRRILFREVPGKGKRIQACITEDEFYYGHSITPFKPFEDHQKDLEYILGIANSKLISWFGRYTLTNFGKDVFPKLNPNDVKELPVPKTFLLYEKISNIVQDILIAKNTAPFANTIEQEAAIDLLVYELYGLTDDEIKIVENEMIE
jgi:hypothetical protein